ncbi:phage DNA ejection protein [Vibrio fluvialis]|uniref:phage DNA ejection protein n=1 Tax=Vibrio fluvialis TaxID=676 RepID=UPI001EEAD47E|nr:phage DNA ejection protein [Vibrio fluvialis]MCG6365118.1 phage DNA ejection protein [Vibrio fluvialis]
MKGYNPDWSGLLSATSQQAQVLGQLGGLAGRAIADNRSKSQAQEKQKMMQAEVSAAFQSENPDAIAQAMLKYPEASELINKAFNFRNEATRNNFLDTNYKIMSDPKNAEKYLNERVDYLTRIGGEPAETLNRIQILKNNPERFMKMTKGYTASLSPKRWDAYRATQAKEITPYQQEQIDIAKRELALKEQSSKKSGQKKLFKIQKMPDGSLTKFYSDGTEESVSQSDPVKTDDMRKPLSINEADAILLKAPEGAKQAAGFAIRINDSLAGMDALTESGQVSPARAALISRALGNGTVANLTLSPAEQAYMVHATDAVNAVLRKDTGAAIVPAEMTEYGRLYLPQPGDSQKVIEVKRKKLEGRFRTFRGESGLAYEAMKVSDKAYDKSDEQVKSLQVQSYPREIPTTQAPEQALRALQNNPSLAQQFQAKYGYLPEGF